MVIRLIICLISICFCDSSTALAVEKVKVLNDHYFSYKGNPLILIGDSGTQCVMQNMNLDYKAWIDDLDSKGIKSAMIWSWMAVSQKSDSSVVARRYGYVIPDITPWVRSDNGVANDGKSFWNLNKFDHKYWDRLKDVISYAESKDIVMLITVFDGWPKRFWSHPFNINNGGPLSSPSYSIVSLLKNPLSCIKKLYLYGLSGITNGDGRKQFWELSNYDSEVLNLPFDESWSWQLKNQFYQEKFAERLIKVTSNNSNVIYELVNEGSNNEKYDQHWISFFKKRCDNIIIINDDYTPLNARINQGVDAISWHSHHGDDPSDDDPFSLNHRWVSGFNDMPAKPIINSETVPSYYNDSLSTTDFRKIIWSTAVAGGSIFIQDDTVFAFDPNAPQKPKGDLLRKHIGDTNKFFNDSGVGFEKMEPHNEIIKSGTAFALALLGEEYVIYVLNNEIVKVDLTDTRGTLRIIWFNPTTGKFTEMTLIEGGRIVSFTPPFSDDAALWIRKCSVLQ